MKLTVDVIYMLGHIAEKGWEYGKDTVIVCINIKKADEKVQRKDGLKKKKMIEGIVETIKTLHKVKE